jgi:hypothetical protein
MEKKFRILTLLLIFSGAINIALVAAFVFMNLKETAVPFAVAKAAPKEGQPLATNSKLLGSMVRLSFRELVSFLTNREPVEEGYTRRDLALAALVSSHHFHLEKALAAAPAQVRAIPLPEGQKVDVYPGLNEEQFEAIIRFAYQEKWPLTSKELFLLLQKKEGPSSDESLQQTFLLTPEFYALQTFFQKSGAPQDPALLLHLVVEGNWDILERFAREQSQVLDFSADKRRALLLDYLSLHSQAAAQILLRTDFAFALKRLEDRGILELLALLKKQSEEGTQFCLELLRSPRGDAIWQAAAMTLYAYAGELPTMPIDPKAVLARFSPTAPVAAAPASAPTVARFHVVKEGESLWKISRHYKVKVDEIIRINGLEKDSLFPGMTLKLPQGTGSEPPR